MTIKDQITNDMKTAMKAQEKERLAVIRLILAALKQREVDERIVLTDEQILTTLNKMIKQRRESIKQFEEGKRLDLAQKENFEISIIQQYLPAQMSEAEIEQTVGAVIQEIAANSPKDMGRVMATLKSKLQGKADMTIVSAKVKEKLAG
jgi:hypothetical protein